MSILGYEDGPAREIAIIHESESLSHKDVCQIADAARRYAAARTVVIDLWQVEEATTSAFAQLVLLRRALLEAGRDLVLVGLRSRAAHLFGISRLEAVLPCA